MNIILTGEQIARLAKFAGLPVVECTDTAVLQRQVSVVETRMGNLSAGYWDVDQEEAVLAELGKSGPFHKKPINRMGFYRGKSGWMPIGPSRHNVDKSYPE